MRRRDFIAVLGGTTIFGPRIAAAQQPAKIWQIGWIWSGPSTGNPKELAGFKANWL
jgi:hypothetical protein